MDHAPGDFHACRCTHTRPPRPLLPHAGVFHLHAVAATTSTRPPRPDTSMARGRRPLRPHARYLHLHGRRCRTHASSSRCRRCRTHETSTPTSSLSQASVLHADTAVAARRRPPPPRRRRRCDTQASSTSTVVVAARTRPPPPRPPSLLQQLVTLDKVWSMRQQLSKILPFVYLQNNVSIFIPSPGNSTENWEKMSVSSQMYWMQMFTYSVICRLPAYYSIMGSNWENEKMLRC
jgi:hypothetical protein